MASTDTTRRQFSNRNANSFYDHHILIGYRPIPSKVDRYKHVEGQKEPSISLSAKTFASWVRTVYDQIPKRDEAIPIHTGPVLVSIDITMPVKRFHREDLDNKSKMLLDCFEGIYYERDSQVVALYVRKRQGSNWGTRIGIKNLSPGDTGWLVPPVVINENADLNGFPIDAA